MVEKIWGWDKLLPKGISVSWSDYSTYLKEYHHRNVHAVTKALFRCEKFLDFATVAFSFVFDKYYLIID